MSQPYKTTRSTAQVVVGGVSPGEHPSVTVIYATAGKGGVARRFVRQLSVSDASLFHRLESEVTKGNQIRVAVTTDWYDTGSVTLLEGFEAVEKAGGVEAVANAHPGAGSRNGKSAESAGVEVTAQTGSRTAALEREEDHE